jgi:hypothetical protein
LGGIVLREKDYLASNQQITLEFESLSAIPSLDMGRYMWLLLTVVKPVGLENRVVPVRETAG